MRGAQWRHARYRRDEGEIAMTPMIDVVFLLLIFFVCTASFQAVEWILPSSLLLSGSSSVEVPMEEFEDLEEIVITIRPLAQGVIWQVNDRPCASRDELLAMLQAVASIDRSLPAIIDCDDRVELGEAIAVYDMARAVGLGRVQFAADAP